MLEKLACALGRKDEAPNIALAEEITQADDMQAVAEIVEGTGSPDKAVAGDCIKVLYEIGDRNPALIADHVAVFLKLLKARNNRLVWGAMTALAQIAPLRPHEIMQQLDAVRKAYAGGSVITVDRSLSLFAALARSSPAYAREVLPIILEHLRTCRPKEVGQHAERAFVCIDADNCSAFKEVLAARRDALSAAQRKRVDKLLKRITEGTFAG